MARRTKTHRTRTQRRPALPSGNGSGRAFATRQEFAARFGIFGASMMMLGSDKGGILPPRCRVACLVDGELKEARSGESTHREITAREAIPGSSVVDGYTYDQNAALCDQAHGDAGKPETL